MRNKLVKSLALALAGAMVLSTAACGDSGSSSTTTDSTEAAPVEAGTEDAAPTATATTASDTLVVGTPEMNGDFIEGFGNSSYDLWIKEMTNEYYYNVYQTPAGELKVAETNVVESYDVTENEDGSKTYTFKIYEDLLWNNGEGITAADYVAALLIDASPEWVTAGASSSAGEGLVGYSAYYAGETTDFAGVQLVDDYTFALTIAADKLPYFWEISYVQVGPLYQPVWTPGLTVVSDENGSHFEAAEGDVKEVLLADLQNVANTERYAPSVTSGPYKFVSFENSTVTLELNENFKCDYEGNVPTIKYVVQKYINQDTDVDQVIAGEVDLTTGVIEGDKIEAAKSADSVELNSYLRAGYGMITFACDFGPTADANVRKALSALIDRSAVLDYVLGGYGGTVEGCYGMAQWVYQEKAADLLDAVDPITFNVDTANAYLDQTDYIYEADGTTPFDVTKVTEANDYIRYNSAGEPLVIEHFGTSENSVTDIIEIQYKANAWQAGVKINVTRGDFATLLDNYYYGYEIPEDERIYMSFNMASNMTAVDDKYYSFHSDYCGTWQNANQISDPELDELIVAMRELDPTQTEEYADLWVQFQTRFNQLMPIIPLYSNEYFDIYSNRVSGVATTPYCDYAMCICSMTKN